MKIYYHAMAASALKLTQADLEELSIILDVPFNEFADFTSKKGYRILTKKLDDSEIIGIYIPESDKAYSSIKLQGNYFYNYPHFPVHKFREFYKSRGGNLITSDISFEDDAEIKDLVRFSAIRNCCLLDNYKDFLKGSCVAKRKKKKGEVADSNNRGGIPDVHANHALIHIGNRNSTMPVKIYKDYDKPVKFEITINSKDRNAAIIEKYNPDSVHEWETLAKAALVACINFVSPSSKGKKQLDWWEKFLDSEVKPIKWSKYKPEKPAKEPDYYQELKKCMGYFQNLSRRAGVLEYMEESLEVVRNTFIDVLHRKESDSFALEPF